MRLPNQAMSVQRMSAAAVRAGVSPAAGLGNLLGGLGGAACQAACGNDRGCLQQCNSIAGPVGGILGTLGDLGLAFL